MLDPMLWVAVEKGRMWLKFGKVLAFCIVIAAVCAVLDAMGVKMP